jgi:hypothetical protein
MLRGAILFSVFSIVGYVNEFQQGWVAQVGSQLFGFEANPTTQQFSVYAMLFAFGTLVALVLEWKIRREAISSLDED